MKQEGSIPNHVAIIMDGNRRWARKHGLPALAGHRYVADNIIEPLVEHAAKRGISYMTFWAWSTENWERRKDEVTGIMRIFRNVIRKRWARLHKKGIRIRVIGDVSKFEPDIRTSLEKVMEETKENNKITVVFALNYGGRDEVLRAIKKLHGNVKGQLSNVKLNEKEFSQFLDTVGVPDPDFIIRPGGEQRLSGFLLWQSEYSELYFPRWYMPEFTPEKLDTALAEFARRKRRFGR